MNRTGAPPLIGKKATDFGRFISVVPNFQFLFVFLLVSDTPVVSLTGL